MSTASLTDAEVLAEDGRTLHVRRIKYRQADPLHTGCDPVTATAFSGRQYQRVGHIWRPVLTAEELIAEAAWHDQQDTFASVRPY
jgi:hypothetical protein